MWCFRRGGLSYEANLYFFNKKQYLFNSLLQTTFVNVALPPRRIELRSRLFDYSATKIKIKTN
jgi:hypothetical protein